MLEGNDGMLNEIERACTYFVAPNFKLICMNVLVSTCITIFAQSRPQSYTSESPPSKYSTCTQCYMQAP